MLSAPHIIAADNREAHILVGQSVPILTSTSTFLQCRRGRADDGREHRPVPRRRQDPHRAAAGELEGPREPPGAAGGERRRSTQTLRHHQLAIVHHARGRDDAGRAGRRHGHHRRHHRRLDHERTRTGVPYLMDVPVLGRLFRTDNDTTDRTELLITITPVRDPQPRGGARRHRRLQRRASRASPSCAAPWRAGGGASAARSRAGTINQLQGGALRGAGRSRSRRAVAERIEAVPFDGSRRSSARPVAGS